METIRQKKILTMAIVVGICSLLGACVNMSHHAADGNVPAIKKALEGGADINEYDMYGWTPLMWSAYYNQYKAVKYLLEQGADPDAQSTMDFRQIKKGSTPLTIGAYYGYVATTKLFLQAGANPLVKNSQGDTSGPV